MENNKKISDVIFYVDDSGKLDSSYKSNFFVYGGYYFASKKERDSAYNKYKAVSNEVRKIRSDDQELKANRLLLTEKKRLAKCLKKFNSFAVVVDISQVKKSILDNKKSTQRFKDEALTCGIKKACRNMLNSSKIDDEFGQVINLTMYIDEQPTATDGYYGLEELIRKELSGNDNERIFSKAKLNVKLKYRDSKYNN